MMKAFKYRLYPAGSQIESFNQHFGVSRFIYNHGLFLKKTHYETTGKSLSKRKLQDAVVAMKSTEPYHWLNDVNSQAILSALGNLHNAFDNFFKGRAKFPNSKKKKAGWQSFQCPQHVKVFADKKAIQLPKIGMVKAVIHRPLPPGAVIKTCTIKRNPAGQYVISVLCECQQTVPVPSTIESDKTLGIDVGIKVYFADSDGNLLFNPRFLENSLKRLSIEQKIFSRKQINSHGRSKQRLRVAKLHLAVANARHDFQHQITAKLCRENQATSFAVEDLYVKGMIRNRKLARHIADAAWGSFLLKLTYKAAWYGKNVLPVDRWTPSSKTCSCCGWKNDALTLSDRVFHCQECGLVLDRDINASICIKQVALQNVDRAGMVCGVKSSPVPIVVDATDTAKESGHTCLIGSPEAPARSAQAV